MEFDILLALHFVGLLMGAGGGMGSAIVMAQARRMSPEDAGVVRRVDPALGRVSFVGVLVMLATGVGMLFVKSGAVRRNARPVSLEDAVRRDSDDCDGGDRADLCFGAKGNVAAAARLPRIGPIAGGSAMLATILAAFAFH